MSRSPDSRFRRRAASSSPGSARSPTCRSASADSRTAGPGGLTLYASFDQTGGLKPRAPVVISGVKVGQIATIDARQETIAPALTLDLDPTLALPTDTTASIQTAGLLGDRYVVAAARRRGADCSRPGDEITLHRVGGDSRAA